MILIIRTKSVWFLGNMTNQNTTTVNLITNMSSHINTQLLKRKRLTKRRLLWETNHRSAAALFVHILQCWYGGWETPVTLTGSWPRTHSWSPPSGQAGELHAWWRNSSGKKSLAVIILSPVRSFVFFWFEGEQVCLESSWTVKRWHACQALCQQDAAERGSDVFCWTNTDQSLRSFVNKIFVLLCSKAKIISTCMCDHALIQTMTSAFGGVTCYLLCNIRDDRGFHVWEDQLGRPDRRPLPKLMETETVMTSQSCLHATVYLICTHWQVFGDSLVGTDRTLTNKLGKSLPALVQVEIKQS